MTQFEYQGKELDYSYFYIDWKLGEHCNYKCSYCVQQKVNKTNSFPTKENILKAINIIKKIKRDHIDVSIAGGETTLYPDLEFFINTIDKNILNLNKLTVFSNGSKPVKFYENILSGNKKHFLYFSVHPEFFKVDELKSKIEELTSVVNLQVALMYKKTDNIHKYINIIDEVFEQKKYKFSPKIIIIREGDYFTKISSEYNQQDYELIQFYNAKWYNEEIENRKTLWLPQNYKNLEHNKAIMTNNLNFKNMYCIHGATNMWIDNFGFCRGAICHQAKKSKFSLYDNINPYLFKNYISIVKCAVDCCGCKDNLLIPKFSSKENAIREKESLIF